MFNLHSYYRSFMPTFKVYLFVALFMIIGSAAMAEPYKILAFGDSLTAGYGMSPQDAYPAQLETKLKAAGYDVKIQNAGVSGDTTTGGLNRLDWSLQNKPDLVLLGLGANDALRNLNPDIPEKNLDQMPFRIAKLMSCYWECMHRGISARVTHHSLIQFILIWPINTMCPSIRFCWTGYSAIPR